MEFKCKHCVNDKNGKCPIVNHTSEDPARVMCFYVPLMDKKVEMCAYLPDSESDVPDATAIYDGRVQNDRKWNRIFVLYWLHKGAFITSEVIE